MPQRQDIKLINKDEVNPIYENVNGIYVCLQIQLKLILALSVTSLIIILS